MTLEQIFSLASLVALIGWLALAVAPLNRVALIRAARITAGVLAVGYLVQMFTITQPVDTGGKSVLESFSTLAGVVALFSAPGNVMLGWTHYLAFDLFTGSWEAEDAGRIGLPHWAVLIPLFLTFMVGPVGLLVYAVMRTIHRLRTAGVWV